MGHHMINEIVSLIRAIILFYSPKLVIIKRFKKNKKNEERTKQMSQLNNLETSKSLPVDTMQCLVPSRANQGPRYHTLIFSFCCYYFFFFRFSRLRVRVC